MGTVTDKDIAIWVCPYGYTPDVIEFSAGGPEPQVKGCGAHGEPYITRCATPDCTHPTYHPSDLDENSHKPCLAKIPWADTRRAEAELVGYEPLNSTLLGSELPELTLEERQDLIVPPSERLPAKRVRTPLTKQAPGQDDTGFGGTRRYLDIATGARREPPAAVRVSSPGRKRGEMPTMGPANLELYVCPKAHEDWKPIPGVSPPRPNCSQCGKEYISRCAQCGNKYRGIDLEAKFHACGAKIPWAREFEKKERKAGRITWDELEHGRSPSASVPRWKQGVLHVVRFWWAVAIAIVGGVGVLVVRNWLIAQKMIT